MAPNLPAMFPDSTVRQSSGWTDCDQIHTAWTVGLSDLLLRLAKVIHQHSALFGRRPIGGVSVRVRARGPVGQAMLEGDGGKDPRISLMQADAALQKGSRTP